MKEFEGKSIALSRENSMRKPEFKESILDYNYHIGSVQQASDYRVTTEFFINYIRSCTITEMILQHC